MKNTDIAPSIYSRGRGSGDGSGFGDKECCGRGNGIGSGEGYENGTGYGDGNDGIGVFCGKKVHYIDGIKTIIESTHGNFAKGYILQMDLTLVPCYVVKVDEVYAHGNTLREAFYALQKKLYNDDTEDERLRIFKEHFPDFSKKYPADELFAWHHILTGSCKVGREVFCRDKGIDINKDSFTIYEFVALTCNSYGGETIKKLIKNDT